MMKSQKPLRLSKGEPALWFTCATTSNPNFRFSTVAGRYVVLFFFGTASLERNKAVLDYAHEELACFFDDDFALFFGISIDPRDRSEKRVEQRLPGYRYFWDFNCAVSRLYGASAEDSSPAPATYRPFTLVLDPLLRVLENIPLTDPETHNALLKSTLEGLPPIDEHAGVPLYAPVLILPRLFEPALCQELILVYEKHGGRDSGFMREEGGYTVGVKDHTRKRRSDYNLEDDPANKGIMQAIGSRVAHRLVPEIKKVFQFDATRIERHIVACYESELGGFFRPHRDNTTRGTAHRRFAVTLNLNTEEYEGGDLRFPEFGSKTYRAPTGGAVVFSCSLLHEATPVTKGKRYAFLPFLYDEEGKKLREQNRKFLSSEVIDKTGVP